MDAPIYMLNHIRHNTSLTHCTTSLSAVSIHCLLVHRITSILHPQIIGSFHYRLFPVIFLPSKISTASSVSASPSRSDASTQHHVQPTSQEFPIPLRLPTSILCHITSRLQYHFHSLVFFSLIHNISNILFSPCWARVHLIFSLPACIVGDHKISISFHAII